MEREYSISTSTTPTRSSSPPRRRAILRRGVPGLFEELTLASAYWSGFVRAAGVPDAGAGALVLQRPAQDVEHLAGLATALGGTAARLDRGTGRLVISSAHVLSELIDRFGLDLESPPLSPPPQLGRPRYRLAHVCGALDGAGTIERYRNAGFEVLRFVLQGSLPWADWARRSVNEELERAGRHLTARLRQGAQGRYEVRLAGRDARVMLDLMAMMPLPRSPSVWAPYHEAKAGPCW